MESCAGVRSNVCCFILSLFGIFILIVTMVLAIFNAASTLIFILANLIIRSNSLYTLYAIKQMQICASMRFSVK